MASAEWRTRDRVDTLLIVDEACRVREARLASAELLSQFLTGRGVSDLQGEAVDGDKQDPAVWGDLVIARAESGEVLTMDPGLFWEGIYLWFRSRGVDYDSTLSASAGPD